MHLSGSPVSLLAAQTGFSTYLPILILLAVVIAVIGRLPRVELGHSDGYRRRRLMNWLPLGLTYAFLYMGRYNLTVSKNEFADLGLMTNADFGVIFGIGTVVYGVSFLINGPLTDRYGGKLAIVLGSAGSSVMNLVMALVTAEVVAGGPGPITETVTAISQPFFGAFRGLRGLFGLPVGDTEASALLPALSLLYAANMYFQSFGAVAIVKVNSSWFHVRERGVFGAIFGTLISLGVFLAYDVGGMIVNVFDKHYVFLVPSVLLAGFCVLCIFMVRDTPGQAGHRDFDTGDASSGDEGP
ncbi:MAG: MFS transporter, partial [Nannocystaceae bacterium]